MSPEIHETLILQTKKMSITDTYIKTTPWALRMINNRKASFAVKFSDLIHTLIYIPVETLRYISEKRASMSKYKRNAVQSFMAGLWRKKTFLPFLRRYCLSVLNPFKIIYIFLRNYVYIKFQGNIYINEGEYIYNFGDIYMAPEICMNKVETIYKCQT